MLEKDDLEWRSETAIVVLEYVLLKRFTSGYIGSVRVFIIFHCLCYNYSVFALIFLLLLFTKVWLMLWQLLGK